MTFFYIHTVLDLHAMILKIFYQRQDHALVLVVFGETQGAEIRQAVNMMHIAAKITLHFQSARPALESEHRLPIEPEICAPEGFGKHIGDLLSSKSFSCVKNSLDKAIAESLSSKNFFVRVGVLAAVYRGTAERIVRVVLIEPVILVQHRNSRRFNGRHIPEGIPHDLEVVIHFTASAHEEAFCHILASVAAAALASSSFSRRWICSSFICPSRTR